VQGAKWVVRTRYANNLHLQGSELILWQPKGYEPFVLATPISFTIRQLQQILFAACWRVTPGARVNQDRHLRGREHWFFEPMPASASSDPRIATMIGHLYGLDAIIAQEREQRAVVESIFNQHLQEVV
jgi:hypothetical protein